MFNTEQNRKRSNKVDQTAHKMSRKARVLERGELKMEENANHMDRGTKTAHFAKSAHTENERLSMSESKRASLMSRASLERHSFTMGEDRRRTEQVTNKSLTRCHSARQVEPETEMRNISKPNRPSLLDRMYESLSSLRLEEEEVGPPLPVAQQGPTNCEQSHLSRSNSTCSMPFNSNMDLDMMDNANDDMRVDRPERNALPIFGERFKCKDGWITLDDPVQPEKMLGWNFARPLVVLMRKL